MRDPEEEERGRGGGGAHSEGHGGPGPDLSLPQPPRLSRLSLTQLEGHLYGFLLVPQLHGFTFDPAHRLLESCPLLGGEVTEVTRSFTDQHYAAVCTKI